jgi:hypothetical protein
MTARLPRPSAASARQPGALSDDEMAAIVAGPVRDALIDGLAKKLNTTVVGPHRARRGDTAGDRRRGCDRPASCAPARTGTAGAVDGRGDLAAAGRWRR